MQGVWNHHPYSYRCEIPGKHNLWLISNNSQLGYGKERLLIKIETADSSHNPDRDFAARDITDSHESFDYNRTGEYLDKTVNDAIIRATQALNKLESSLEITPEFYEENIVTLKQATYEARVYLAIIKGLELHEQAANAMKKLNDIVESYNTVYGKVEQMILADTWDS